MAPTAFRSVQIAKYWADRAALDRSLEGPGDDEDVHRPQQAPPQEYGEQCQRGG
jgi:hypothetical protein